ncbi:MAG: AAA family ATPase [Muribaculaceae bacterium]|nr:AAA family ATPase [Muribaculaceae bacterium]
MKNITIHDFRCFRQLSVDFTPGVNLLIGDNASGKTSFLLACKYAINCFFSGYSDQFTLWSSPQKDDFLRLNIGEKRFGTQPIEIGFSYFKNELDESEAFGLDTNLQVLVCKSEKNRKPLLSGLKHLRDYGKFLLSSSIKVEYAKEQVAQAVALPLIASYSTHGIHKNQKVNSNYFKEINQTPSFGYYLCGSTDGLLEHWIRRMLILMEAGKNFTEQNVVIRALMDMFGEMGCNVISGFDVRINYKDIICIFKDGRETPVSILSDGYRRLVSIVMDIAFRCALLNGLKYGEEAARKTKGTVIIDEIDLHLHPSLQSIVLKALQNTFPNIQFIVSTHAPMVMSGVESDDRNCVMRMEYDAEGKAYLVNRVNTYGMDLSTLAETVLKVPSRNPAVKEELDILVEYIDNEEYAEAKKLLARLKEQFGDRLPELSGFDTQISIEEALQ